MLMNVDDMDDMDDLSDVGVNVCKFEGEMKEGEIGRRGRGGGRRKSGERLKKPPKKPPFPS